MTRAFRSEWIKLRRRSMLLGGGGALVALAVLGTVLGVERAGAERGDLTIARLSQADGFAFMLQRAGAVLGIVALGVTAIAVAQEYSNGTLRNLLVREPRRLRLLAGKVSADVAFVLMGAALACAASLAVALVLAPGRGVDTSGWLGSGLGTTLGTAGNVLVAVAGWSVFGALLALVLRSPAPAVIIGAAWSGPIEGLLKAAWQSLGHWLPGQQLVAIIDGGNDQSAYAWALGLSAVFLTAAAVAGGALFRRRDVAV